jgi:hypothetical protein
MTRSRKKTTVGSGSNKRAGQLAMLQSTPGLAVEVLDRAGIESNDKKDFYLCQFHEDRSPSMHIHKQGRKFKCMTCGANGDAIDLVQKIWDVPWKEAVRMLSGGLSDPGWTTDRLERLAASVGRDEVKYTRSVCRRLWHQTGGNAYFLRRTGALDPDVILDAIEWADHYFERVEDAEGCAPLSAYLGLVRVCVFLSGAGKVRLPKPQRSSE